MTITNDLEREPRTKACIRIAAWGMGLAIILSLPQGPLAMAAEPPQAESLSESAETTVTEASKHKKRRRQRASRKRRSRSAQKANQRSQSMEKVYGRLQLDGSFALQFGGTNIVHGEGSTTIELDRAAVDRLADAMGENLEKAVPALSKWLQIIEALPQTLESTSEILHHLTDPETQQQLRQVEQLLQLLPKPAE